MSAPGKAGIYKLDNPAQVGYTRFGMDYGYSDVTSHVELREG